MSDDMSLKHDALYMMRGHFGELLEEYRRGELDHFLGNGREYVFAIFPAPAALRQPISVTQEEEGK